MGAICGGQGDRQKAYRLLMEAQDVYKDIGDVMLGNFVQVDNAWQVWNRGDLRKGLAFLEDYLDDLQQAHFKWAVCQVLSGLSWMNLILGEYAEAQRMAEESLKARRSYNTEIDEALGQYDLGIVTFAMGNLEQARQYLESALGIFRKYQSEFEIASTLNYLGLVAIFEGSLGEGLVQLEESRAFCERIENPNDVLVVDNLLYLGEAVSQQGDYAKAGELIRQSLEQVWSANELPRIPSRFEGLAAVALGCVRHHDSATLLGAAHKQRQVIGAPLWPVEQSAYNKLLSSLKAALSEAEFQQDWETGAAMSVEQSITFALEKTAKYT